MEDEEEDVRGKRTKGGRGKESVKSITRRRKKGERQIMQKKYAECREREGNEGGRGGGGRKKEEGMRRGMRKGNI